MEITHFLGILFLLMCLQVVGTHMQVKRYKAAVRRLHALGAVGIGSQRKMFGAGEIVLLAVKSDGSIQAAERMRGMTIWARFKPVPELVGDTIQKVGARIEALPVKEQKKHKALLDAVEALMRRFEEEALKKE
ncbi:hypothetical protein TAMA11512_04670 [Selenomonas sp. TAMA-11512]|uniref:transcriptional regulator GutM n=1 Tax=Selenomonas sp. TAMA-11512 TaxID=3095337 RepID=UPI00308A4864|nr:hypothetical protein TAMA11512_04670 [Selenomonas sp. TAMA-11512]